MTNLYAQAVPVVRHKLANLKHIVKIGQKHAAEHGVDEAALTQFRLFPDMLSFAAQIRIATDLACGMTMRLTDNERLSLNDDANSFDELIARLDQTLAHLKAQNEAEYDNTADKPVTIKPPSGELSFVGNDYLTNFLLPNLYFHIVTAYNMLRHNGVKLGKMDYMNGAAWPGD